MTTTIVKDRRRSTTRRSAKPRRDVTSSDLPLRDDGKVDLVKVLEFALTAPGHLSKCYNRFHRYSLLNIIMVLMQTGKMEPMATFNRWKSLGRNVTKGSKALWVNHPRFAPERDSDGLPVVGKDGKVEMKVVGFYPKATVFQLHQTEGPDLKMPELPEWDREQAAKVLELNEVPFEYHDGNAQGYSTGRDYAINPVAEYPIKTLFHEWGHILCGHTTGDDNAPMHRGVREFQAEAVALLVCKELDVKEYDPAACRGYIQNWLQGQSAEYLDDDGNLAVTDAVVRQIFAAADKILTAGRKSHYDKMEADRDNAQR